MISGASKAGLSAGNMKPVWRWSYDPLGRRLAFDRPSPWTPEQPSPAAARKWLDVDDWIDECIHAEDQALVRDTLAGLAQPGRHSGVRPLTLRLVRARGRTSHFSVRAFVQRDAQGRVLQIGGQAQDVSAGLRLEKVVGELRSKVVRLAADLDGQVLSCTAALFESEKQLRATVDMAEFGIVHVAPDGLLIRANPRFCAIVGYSEQEMREMPAGALIHPEDLQEDQELIARLLAGKVGDYAIDKRYRHRDGRTVWVHATGSVARDEAGKVLYRITVVTPIGDAQGSNSLWYRELFDHHPLPMWTYDMATLAFTSVNDAAVRSYGYSRAEFLGMTLRDIRPPEGIAMLDMYASRPKDRFSGVREVEHRRKDGSLLSVEISSHQMAGDGRPMRLVLATDLTERKQAGKLLAAQKVVLEQIASGAPLHHTLSALAQLLRSDSPGLCGSILLLDDEGKHLTHGAAAGLPMAYVKAIDGVAIGAAVGSCGTAAFRGETVIVADIATDPLWADFRALAAEHGLHACTSVPIKGADGVVLGTFAAYLPEPRPPSARELQLIETLVHTATIAITKSRAGAALLDSETRYRATFEMAALGIGNVGRSRRFQHVNERLCAITGYDASELLLTGPEALTHPDDRATDAALIAQLWRGEIQQYSVEKRYLRKDGSSVWVNVAVSAVLGPDGAIQYTMGISEDISWRKQVEADLQQQQALNALLLENLAEGVVACDSDGKLMMFNRMARDWHGTDASTLPQQQWAQAFDLYAADGKTLLTAERIPLVRASRGERVRDEEFCIVRAGREPRHVLASGGPLLDASGHRHGAVVVMHDMTAHKRQERRFTNLFEFAPDAIVMADAAGIVRQINHQAESLFGWTRSELVGQPIEHLMPEMVRKGHVDLRAGFLQTAQPRSMGAGSNKLLGLRKDGSTFPIDISLSPMEGDDGPMVAAAIRDVTERLHAEQTVRQALATLDATADAVFILDPQSLGFIFVNEGAVRQLGYTRQELMAMTPLEIAPDYGQQSMREALEASKNTAGAAIHFDTRHRHKDGRIFPVEINLQYLALENMTPRFVAVVRDVTERQRALRELSFVNELNEATRSLVGAEQVMETATRLLGKHLQVSRCAYADFTPDGRRFTVLHDYTDGCASSVGEYALPALGSAVVDSLREGKALVIRDVEAELPGDETLANLRTSQIAAFLTFPLIKGGCLRAMMAVHQTTPRNWTDAEIALVHAVAERSWATVERARAQRDLELTAGELRLANAAIEGERSTLAQRVAERTAELMNMNADLSRAKEAAEAASRAKSAFLATVSHEIRTPMHGVLGAMELLDRTGLDAQRAQLLNTAQESARSLLELLNDLLDMAKIEAGRVEVIAKPISMRAIVDQVLSTHLPNAIGKGISLTGRVDPQLPLWLNADALRLRQILGNLISNAVKFTAHGGVELVLDVQRVAPRLHSLRFSVRDTGSGIDPANLANLFQPFEQGADEFARKSGGTGLGLAICRGLAESMGGSVTLTSAAGQGTTAVLQLELDEVEPPPTLRTPVEDGQSALRRVLADGHEDVATRGDMPQVLVVDDHPTNRMVLVSQLRQLGLTAVAAVDGAQALELLEEGVFGMVITDCEMPRMDGYALAQAIRRDGVSGGVLPIIACTAHALPDVAQRCRNSGIDEVLTKPVSLASLADTVSRWWPAVAAARKPASAPVAVAAATDGAIDLSQLALMSGGDRAMERETLAEFGADLVQTIAELERMMARADFDQCVRLAHRAKGACKVVGAHQLATLFGELESALGSQPRAATLEPLWSALQAQARAIAPVLQALATAQD